MIYNLNITKPDLAKVGGEGSNPFARSNDFNSLDDGAFAAERSLPAFRFVGVLIGAGAQKISDQALKVVSDSCKRFVRFGLSSFLS